MSKFLLLFSFNLILLTNRGVDCSEKVEKSTPESDKRCQKVLCEMPASNEYCTIIDSNDHSVHRPRGKNADCCPLWKCAEKDKPGFYTFHGLRSVDGDKTQGGNETVHYSGPSSNRVSSVGTGNHDAVAIAAPGNLSPKNAERLMTNMFNQFKLLGFPLSK